LPAKLTKTDLFIFGKAEKFVTVTVCNTVPQELRNKMVLATELLALADRAKQFSDHNLRKITCSGPLDSAAT